MAKITLGKSTADGEMINVEIELTKDHFNALLKGIPLVDQLKPFFELGDQRMYEMNQRIIASSYMVKKLSPEGRTAFNDVVAVFHGRGGVAREDALEAARLEYEENKRKIQEHDAAVQREEALIKANHGMAVDEAVEESVNG